MHTEVKGGNKLLVASCYGIRRLTGLNCLK